MKAIIQGKRYDTEKASLIAETSFGCAGDFRAYSEELYQTKTGAWFLAGEGGPMTKYSTPCDTGGCCGGRAIIPLSTYDAQTWLEEHGEIDALEQHFTDSIVDA